MVYFELDYCCVISHLFYLHDIPCFTGNRLWIHEVDEGKSITKIRLLALTQGLIVGVAIIGRYMFLFYMPLGVALGVIYLCPIVGMLLTRLAPHGRFGKYASIAAAVTMLVACFAVRRKTRLSVVKSSRSPVQSIHTPSQKKNINFRCTVNFALVETILFTLCLPTARCQIPGRHMIGQKHQTEQTMRITKTISLGSQLVREGT